MNSIMRHIHTQTHLHTNIHIHTTAVDGIHYVVDDQFADGMFKACVDVKFSTLSVRTVSMVTMHMYVVTMHMYVVTMHMYVVTMHMYVVAMHMYMVAVVTICCCVSMHSSISTSFILSIRKIYLIL